MELNYKGVAVLTRSLPALRKNQLLKRFKTNSTTQSETIAGEHAFVLWVADLLAASGILGQSQQDLIFNSEMGDRLLDFGVALSRCYAEEATPVGHLGLINRTFASVTKVEGVGLDYLDLTTGDIVGLNEAFRESPIEVIHYNLTSLFATRMSAYNRLKKMPKPEVPNAVLHDQVN